MASSFARFLCGYTRSVAPLCRAPSIMLAWSSLSRMTMSPSPTSAVMVPTLAAIVFGSGYAANERGDGAHVGRITASENNRRFLGLERGEFAFQVFVGLQVATD